MIQHLPTDVLASITSLISKTDAAYLAVTCKLLSSKLPPQLQREIHGNRLLLRQSRKFFGCLVAIRGLRSFLSEEK